MYEYMAPEVIKGERYNQSADYYALGIVANELMFGIGKRPYKGAYPRDMREAFKKYEY